MKIAIIGAGTLGLTCAYELSLRGHEITLLEKEDKIGGLVSDFSYQNWHLEKFYHHLFKTDSQIIKLIKEVGLGDKLIWQTPETCVYYQQKIYPFDSAFDVLKFSPLGILDRIRLGIVVLYLKLQPNYRVFQNQTAVFWLRKYLGEKTFSVLWEPLLKAKFGEHFDKIAMSWFWARVHYRTQSLGYLRGGFYQLYSRLEELVKSRRAKIRLGVDIKKITSNQDKTTIDFGQKKERFDKVIATIPTGVFFKLAPELGDEYKESYPPAIYLGAQTVVVASNRQILPGVYWLNINDTELPFLAYVEQTNFMSPSDYNNTHLVYLGNYLSTQDSRYLKSEKETFSEHLEALKKLNPDFDKSWVKKVWLFRTPFAQPIVGVDYEQHLPPFQTPLKNVYLANMAQVYPQDRGQNYSVKLALEVSKVVENS